MINSAFGTLLFVGKNKKLGRRKGFFVFAHPISLLPLPQEALTLLRHVVETAV
jgi:hypothetical protein